jgi:predicted flap endonuclease-1-like 5' DNA nuclease
MIGRLVLLAGAAAAAAGAMVFGRRKARQRERARRRAERQGKRARTDGVIQPAVPNVAERAPAASATAAPAVTAAVPLSHEGEPTSPAFASIKGIGPALEQRLRASGVTSVAQVAAWSDEDIERLAPGLKVTPERIRRESWVEQARAVTGEGQAPA